MVRTCRMEAESERGERLGLREKRTVALGFLCTPIAAAVRKNEEQIVRFSRSRC